MVKAPEGSGFDDQREGVLSRCQSDGKGHKDGCSILIRIVPRPDPTGCPERAGTHTAAHPTPPD
jgi:hypothetical protein